MVDFSIAQEWIEKADEDFEFALVNLQEGKPFIAQICFHFQQPAEKYLKGYIVAKDLEFRKTHDLSMLLSICMSQNSAFEALAEECEYLNTFYVESRYPVHWPTDFSRREAENSSQAAEKIRSLVKRQLRIS
jgi:HEPN domain-containing protein